MNLLRDNPQLTATTNMNFSNILPRKVYFQVWLIVFAVCALPVSAATDAITKVVVTTKAQQIAKNTASAVITLQTQNTNGEAEKVSETTDVGVTSSSSSGEFSSNATSWKAVGTLVMSTNSANRSVYYKDSAEGTHTLTFTVTGRTSGKKWVTTHIITVGIPSSGQNNNTATSTSSVSGGGEANGESTETENDHNSSISTHGSGEELSDKITKEVALKVSAGRKRAGHTGAPILFDADWSFTGGRDGIRFVWSFGDGTSEDGERVFHSYAFAGEYVVVVNAYAGNYSAVSRTGATIIDPQVIIRENTDYLIELHNNGAQEINLSGWSLRQGNRVYTIPLDTILLSKATIRILRLVTRLPNEGMLALNNPSSRPMVTVGQSFVSRTILVSETETTELEEIKKRLALIMAVPEADIKENALDIRQESLVVIKDSTQEAPKGIVTVMLATASTTEMAAVAKSVSPSRLSNLSIVKWMRRLWGR